ncbi:MAG TPA: ThuA domain-containing protein [Rhodothermales bacterium]
MAIRPGLRLLLPFQVAPLTLLVTLVWCSLTAPGAAAQGNVLVFSRTEGFRHNSISAGIQMVMELGQANGFTVTATEDASVFTSDGLAPYDAVIFLNTTGNVLSDAQQQAFEAFIRGGGGYVGIHSAADTEYDWPFYGQLVGAWFRSHPEIQEAEVRVADLAHPSTSMLPRRWVRTDELYNYQTNPRGDVHVLATLGEDTYTGGQMGTDHPIAWCHPFQGGRSWYTGLGHTSESYTEPLFRAHVLGGIRYAAGLASGDCSATIESSWEKTVLDPEPLNPMELAVTPDGRIFYVERGGTMRVIHPNGEVSLAGSLVVTTANEDGLLGIALDPSFAENNWIYLFYSPAAESEQRISRFTMDGSELDLASERILLEIPTQRAECCHSGGSLTFGPGGNLFASLGDNTNPFASDGFAPIDERSGRSPWDAQKSSGNMNDLRGKILRIHPEPDGTYTIPEGNLFPADGSAGRPEIYVMGNRNPFRISVDQETGWLYWGEVGPDANSASSTRGPAGHDEWNQARAAGNFGWPFCIADNKPYRDYGFASGTSGDFFDCAAPVNNSPNNTGGQVLPPAQPAWIWYPYGNSAEFPEVGSGGRTAMGGPVYHYDPNLQSNRKLPAYYDDTVFIYEWSRGWLKEVKLDENGDILKINPFLPHLEFLRPMDMELGPDGALYMIEWGSGFNGNNIDAKIVRLDYQAAEIPTQSETPQESRGMRVYRPYPNPTTDGAELVYELDEDLPVTIELFDATGRRVATVVNAIQSAGAKRAEIDTRGLAAGVYFYRISTPLSRQSGEIVVVR